MAMGGAAEGRGAAQGFEGKGHAVRLARRAARDVRHAARRQAWPSVGRRWCAAQVRACAWERYGDTKLASLSAALQLKYHRCATDAGSGGAASAANAAHSSADAGGANVRGVATAVGHESARPTATDRLLAACKLALLTLPQQGEHAALTILLALRDRCAAPPVRSIWLQHTADVLIRGALLRGERRRASELLAQQRALLSATDGPSDATWGHELELMLQTGDPLEVLLRAEEMTRRPATGRGAGAASPQAMLLWMQAKAHSLGGEPLSAMPHALSAMALAEKASLQGLYSAAALELVSVQLNVDPMRANTLLQRVRAQVMRNGSAYEIAQLQLLSAKCRLAMLPNYSDAKPLQLQQLQPHILPALADALAGFARLRCHSEVAGLLYIRARIWHSVNSVELVRAAARRGTSGVALSALSARSFATRFASPATDTACEQLRRAPPRSTSPAAAPLSSTSPVATPLSSTSFALD